MSEKFDAAGFREKIEAINKYLLDCDEAAISRDTSGPYKSTGYAWQYIVDAVNSVFDGWRYDLLDLCVSEKAKSFYAEARIQLDIIFNGEPVTRGTTVGSSSNVNQGDAQKGAITDALKKSFSLFSIGNKAMRGELDPKDNKKAAKPPVKKANPAPAEGPPSDLFISYCEKIAEAADAEALTVVGEAIALSNQEGKLSDGDRADLAARGKARKAELKKD